MPTLVAVAAIAAVVLLYYAAVGRIGDWAGIFALRWFSQRRSAEHLSVTDAEAFIRLSIGCTLQVSFCALIVTATRVTPVSLFTRHIDWAILLIAPLIGIAEFALGAYLGFMAIRIGLLIRAPRSATSNEAALSWMLLARAGWMRWFLRTLKISPASSFALSTLYVAGEEIIFRGFVVGALRSHGIVVAVGVSAALFIAAQMFRMPSWESAMFPMLGALVVGITNALLFFYVPWLLPLIVAHAVFFAAAIV
jgi:hypothetical protein